MIRVIAYRESEHFEMLKAWWKHWGHPVVPADELSSTGYVICWEDKPILIGFMILTNAKFAFIESVCANPETHYEDREDAIIELTRVISVQAKELGFRRLLAIPQKERLAEKAAAGGFIMQAEKCFLGVKEL